MTVVRVYLSNILAAWTIERQEQLCAEKVPGWPNVATYREDVAPRHRKSHSAEALVERNKSLLRRTARRGAETIYVASLALLGWELRDFQRCLVAAEARNATVVALDTGRTIPPTASRAELADAGDEFVSRRKSAQTDPAREKGRGGEIAGERRAAAAKARAMVIEERWKRREDSTPDLLAEAGLSYNTASKYLGPRPDAQRKHELGLEQAARNRQRRKSPA